jgi:hypothetical protein
MIGIASRATAQVNLPSRKLTRDEVIATFKKEMGSLKARLNVSHYIYKMLSDPPSHL